MELKIVFFLFCLISTIFGQNGNGNGNPNRVDPCQGLPTHAELKQALVAVVSENNAGFGFQMWGSIVNLDGEVCAIAYSGEDRHSQYFGSRAISLQKANAANAFGLNDFSLSTANLYAPTQPGGSLYGISDANSVNTALIYGGSASDFGTAADPLIGKRPGGTITFGGGLVLYAEGKMRIGGIGVSGDTSCADHIIVWKLRHLLGLDYVPNGVSASPYFDNIIYDINPQTGKSASGFGHPHCIDPVPELTAALNLPPNRV